MKTIRNKSTIGYFALVAVLFGVMFTSCQEDAFDDIPRSEDLATASDVPSRQVSIGQAEAFANMLSNSIFRDNPALKSSTADADRSNPEVNALVSESSDTTMYAVNFGNNLGYMLLSADSEAFPIIGLADSGSIDPSSLNPTLSGLIEEMAENISSKISEQADTSNQNYKLWNSFDKEESQVSFQFVESIPEPNLKLAIGRRQHSTNKATIYPWTGMYYKWGQAGAYNNSLDNPAHLVGCPAVAIGFLCMHHWFPNQFGYMYMPTKYSSDNGKENSVSKMFKEITDAYGSNYSFGYRVSGAPSWSHVGALKRLGYKNAKYISDRASDELLDVIYNELESGSPV